MDYAASLTLIAPELLLSVAGLVLLLAAAWLGDKASRAISIAAAILLGACFFLVAPSVCAGQADPIRWRSAAIRGRCLRGFAKLMIFAAAGAALVVAPAFFERVKRCAQNILC